MSSEPILDTRTDRLLTPANSALVVTDYQPNQINTVKSMLLGTEDSMSKRSDAIALIGRCLMAVMFFLSGFGKVVAPAATIAWIASTGLPMPAVGYVVCIIVELGGAVLLVLGWQTRVLGVALSVFAIATAFIFHRNVADQNQLFHFLKNIAVMG
jgi:putative oxidoreductase